MTKRLFPLLLVVTLAACSSDSPPPAADSGPAISGRLDAGLRVLTLDPAATGQSFTIYRGDYVRPELAGGGSFTLEIPALEVARTFPAPGDERPYFKVPEAGRFEFTLGEASGVIEAIEYRSARYREVTAKEAAELIANVDPLILDVRTGREFAGGHLEGAVLIPVHQFKQRLGEIPAGRDDPVFVYCRTGNRSTVAARLLNQAGYTRVINLRRGIVEWRREGLPVVR